MLLTRYAFCFLLVFFAAGCLISLNFDKKNILKTIWSGSLLWVVHCYGWCILTSYIEFESDDKSLLTKI